MASSRDELLFPPFSFTARPVPVATDEFDFEQWKHEPSAPIILKGTLTDWPLFQNLKNCRIGNSFLQLVRTEDAVRCVDELAARGIFFYS